MCGNEIPDLIIYQLYKNTVHWTFKPDYRHGYIKLKLRYTHRKKWSKEHRRPKRKH